MTAESRHSVCLDAEQLAAFADGGLSPSERESIETHLSECDHCYEALVGIAAITTQIAPHAVFRMSTPLRVRRSLWWIGGALAAAAGVILLINVNAPLRSRLDPLEVAIIELAEAPRETRLSAGRLSVDRTWARVRLVLRSGNTGAETLDSFDVQSAAQSVKVLVAQDHSSRGLHYYGLALVAAREYDASIEAFEQALRQSGADEAVIRSDLSAALLERYRVTEQAADAERALAEADRVLSAAPTHLSAAFNRAQILETLRRPEARQAWQAYIDLDRDAASQWRAEAIRLRDGQR
jgi:tetratricopeptide (TPR) repeat protein